MEFSRVLAPGGICIITLDVSLDEQNSRHAITKNNLEDFILRLKDKGLIPINDLIVEPLSSEYLSTNYYRHRPQLLPWYQTHGTSLYRKIKQLVRMKEKWTLRKRYFKQLIIGVFVCRKSG